MVDLINNHVMIIAEIGINHNGSLDIAKNLIYAAKQAGCDAVKFQKRTIDKVYTKEELDAPRESPFGTTNREQKYGLEFNKEDYQEINNYCKLQHIDWFASAWDTESQKFLRDFDCKYNKVASAMLTHKKLLELIAEEKKHTFISTGMSTLEEIDEALKIFEWFKCPFELMHTNSTYPMAPEHANLNVIKTLQNNFENRPYFRGVGYSGHETGIAISIAAMALGATTIERHVTLDRAMYGSDQAASLEIPGLNQLAKHIRTIEVAFGSFEKKVQETELPIKAKLRRIDTIFN